MALKVRKVRINDFGNPCDEGGEEGSTPRRPYHWGRGCGLRRRPKQSAVKDTIAGQPVGSTEKVKPAVQEGGRGPV